MDKQVKQLAQAKSSKAQTRTIAANIDAYNADGWTEALAKWDNQQGAK